MAILNESCDIEIDMNWRLQVENSIKKLFENATGNIPFFAVSKKNMHYMHSENTAHRLWQLLIRQARIPEF